MVEGSNSRYPVYEENIDNIIGVLYMKDAMRIYLMERFNESLLGDIPDLLRDVKFVPKTVDVDDLFRVLSDDGAAALRAVGHGDGAVEAEVGGAAEFFEVGNHFLMD
jgi:hypothetical protein